MREHAPGPPEDPTVGRLASRPRPSTTPPKTATVTPGDRATASSTPSPGIAPSASSPPDTGLDVRRLALPGRRPPLLVVPQGPVQARSLVVFFHGAGGRGEQSLVFVEEVAAARGLLVLLPTSSGSSWDLLTGGLGPDLAALDAALAEVFASHDVDRVAFAGFSDGGSYALSVGLANGDLGDAVLAFSPGFAAPPAQVGRPRVFISHGDADAVLPIDRCGRRLAEALGGAGYDVRYEEFAGGHVVPPEQVRAAVDWWLGGDG
jgi:predicted esterase